MNINDFIDELSQKINNGDYELLDIIIKEWEAFYKNDPNIATIEENNIINFESWTRDNFVNIENYSSYKAYFTYKNGFIESYDDNELFDDLISEHVDFMQYLFNKGENKR